MSTTLNQQWVDSDSIPFGIGFQPLRF